MCIVGPEPTEEWHATGRKALNLSEQRHTSTLLRHVWHSHLMVQIITGDISSKSLADGPAVINNNNNDYYTFPVRRLGVHLDHLEIGR
jgi:hypothetical protein